MKNIEDEASFFKQMMDMLESQLSIKDEVVLHDLTQDYEHTIVDIRNGHVTNRKVGDCGSNIGLEVLRGTVENGDRYNYITHTRDGKVLRSSTMFIRDVRGRIIGSICINKDITDSLKLEAFLREENKYFSAGEEDHSIRGSNEVFFSNVNELLEYMLHEALNHLNKPLESLTRMDKRGFIKYLDEKGVFLISKSSDRACEFLGISKFTLYGHLEKIRGTNGNKKVKSLGGITDAPDSREV